MCKSKEEEQTLPYINSSNAAAATVIGSNDWLTFGAGASNVTICDAAAASDQWLKSLANSSELIIENMAGARADIRSIVVQSGASCTREFKESAKIAHSIPVIIPHNSFMHYMGQTFGEGLYTLELDGTMHLTGESAASASAAAASSADLG